MDRYEGIAVGSNGTRDRFDTNQETDGNFDTIVVRKSGTTFTELTLEDKSGNTIDGRAQMNLTDTYDRGDFINPDSGWEIKTFTLGAGAVFAYRS